jgi:hypothetical protein
MIPVEDLLQELDQERRKYDAHNSRMEEIVEFLVAEGFYPAFSKMGRPALNMVENYGVRWHEWRDPLECPHCNSDLRDHRHGAPFKREISIYDQNLDRTVEFRCPDCEQTINRI